MCFIGCSAPTITLIPSASSLSSPLQYRRSQDFSISSTIEFHCSGSLSTAIQWIIKNCTSTTCSFELDFGDKVDRGSSELYVPSRTLPLGTYQLTLNVQLINQPSLRASAFVYTRITPSGITANPVQLGTSLITRGAEQDLVLDPGRYSVDPDQDSFDASVSEEKISSIL